jgi:tetratricopeptide (TPR) repeat protein
MKSQLLILLFPLFFSTAFAQSSNYYFESAFKKIESKDFRGAVSDYSKIINIDPKNVDAYEGRGKVKGLLGDYEGSLSDFSTAIKINPSSIGPFYNRAITKATMEDFEGASADFSKVIQMDPANALAYSGRGLIYFRKADYEASIADFNKAINIDSTNAFSFNNRSLSNMSLKDFTAAEKDLSKAISLNPVYYEAYYNRGTVFYNLNKFQEAISDYTKAIEINPSDPDSYQSRGVAKLALSDHPGAIADYTKAINLNPKSALLYFNRGNSFLVLEDFEKAKEDYSMAIYLNTNLAEAYQNRGIVKKRLSDFDGALNDFSNAIGLNSTLLQSFQERGAIKILLQDYSGAYEDFSRVIEINPAYEAAYNGRARAAFMIKNFKGSIIDCIEGLNLNPKNSEFYYIRAGAKMNLGDLSGSILDYTKAIELNSEYFDAYIDRGVAKDILEDYDGAITDYFKALSINKESPIVYTLLSKAFVSAKNYEKANEIIDSLSIRFPALGYTTRSVLYYDQKLYNEAIENIFKAYLLEADQKIIQKQFIEYAKKNVPYTIQLITKEINDKSSSIFLLYDRAKLYEHQGLYSNAILDYDTLLNKSTIEYHSYILLLRSHCYTLIDKIDLAFKDYNTAIEIDSTYAYAYLGRGRLKELTGDYTGAKNDYENAIKLNPDESGFHFRKGRLYEKFLLNNEIAIDEFNKAIKLDSLSIYAYYYRGRLFREKYGDTINFKKDFLKILEIDTAVTELENLRQFAYFHLGQFENAIAWQNEIIEKYPNADNYYAAACLYSLLNKIDKSIEHLTIAFQKGFRTFRLMEAEEEMDNVSKTKEFKKLIANWKSFDK